MVETDNTAMMMTIVIFEFNTAICMTVSLVFV